MILTSALLVLSSSSTIVCGASGEPSCGQWWQCWQVDKTVRSSLPAVLCSCGVILILGNLLVRLVIFFHQMNKAVEVTVPVVFLVNLVVLSLVLVRECVDQHYDRCTTWIFCCQKGTCWISYCSLCKRPACFQNQTKPTQTNPEPMC